MVLLLFIWKEVSILKATELDMTHGPLWNKIIIFALPLALTAFLQQLYNAADVAVVGRFVGTEAMAAVGTNVSLIGLLINLFMGISLGANVMIARYIGGRDEEKARAAVHTAFLLALAVGLGLMLLGQFIARPVLALLEVPDSVMGMAETYLRVFLCGMPFMGLYNFQAAVFRSRGDTRTPLVALACTSVLNFLLDLIFAAVCGWGIAGVAAATVIAQLVAAAMLLRVLQRAEGVIRLDFSRLHWDRARNKEILRIGMPAGIQAMVFSLSNVVIQAAINSLGSDTMAASSAAFTIEINIYCFIYAFSQATTTFVSQNYGAGKLFRCRRATWLCLGLGNLFMGLLSVLVLLFGEQLLAIFDSNPAVIALGMVRIWYVVAPSVLNGILDILSGALRGYGYSLQPAVLALLGICGVRLAWVYLAFPASPDFATLMFCYPLSWAVTAVFIGLAYRFYTRNLKVLRIVRG